MTDFIQIKDRKPRDGEWILAYLGEAPYGGVDKYRAGMWINDPGRPSFLSAANFAEQGIGRRFQDEWITAWQPLPKPPEA